MKKQKNKLWYKNTILLVAIPIVIYIFLGFFIINSNMAIGERILNTFGGLFSLLIVVAIIYGIIKVIQSIVKSNVESKRLKYVGVQKQGHVITLILLLLICFPIGILYWLIRYKRVEIYEK